MLVLKELLRGFLTLLETLPEPKGSGLDLLNQASGVTSACVFEPGAQWCYEAPIKHLR